jgi:hypothetical protein
VNETGSETSADRGTRSTSVRSVSALCFRIAQPQPQVSLLCGKPGCWRSSPGVSSSYDAQPASAISLSVSPLRTWRRPLPDVSIVRSCHPRSRISRRCRQQGRGDKAR